MGSFVMMLPTLLNIANHYDWIVGEENKMVINPSSSKLVSTNFIYARLRRENSR